MWIMWSYQSLHFNQLVFDKELTNIGKFERKLFKIANFSRKTIDQIFLSNIQNWQLFLERFHNIFALDIIWGWIFEEIHCLGPARLIWKSRGTHTFGNMGKCPHHVLPPSLLKFTWWGYSNLRPLNCIVSGPVELGAQGAQLHTHFSDMSIETSFQ